jgi:hypothetical protein
MSSTARGSDFLVVWDTVWDNEAQSFLIKGVPVSGSGEAQGGIRILSDGGSAVVASDGTSYLLVYASQFGAYDTPWVSRILSGDLTQVSTERALPNLGRPVLLWRGDRYLAMGRNLGIIDREGNSIADPAPLVAGQFTGIVSAAANTSPRTLVAWTQATRSGNAAMARLYTGQTPVAAAPEFVISTSANRQIDLDVAHSRFGDLVTWRESDGVYATRVSVFGAAIDGRGIELSTKGDAGPPRVALHGTDYVVAWREADTVQLRWISATASLQPQREDHQRGQTFFLTGTNGASGSPMGRTNGVRPSFHESAGSRRPQRGRWRRGFRSLRSTRCQVIARAPMDGYRRPDRPETGTIFAARLLQARKVTSARSRCSSRVASCANSRSQRRIMPEMCPSLRNRSDAAIERSVVSPSCQPIHAMSRRSEPPRMAITSAARLETTPATVATIVAIFGRPTARCFSGWSVERGLASTISRMRFAQHSVPR